MFSITPNNNVARVILKIKGLAEAEKKAIRKAFYDIGKDLVSETRAEINKKPKSGRRYRKYYGVKGKLKSPTYYTASAPGEAPAVVTGNLRKSINFTVSGNSEMAFGVDSSIAGVNYGKYLEYYNLVSMTGRGSNNIAPRPFISAVYKKNKMKIAQRFQNYINAEINK